VDILAQILIQFLFRLSFGVAVAMSIIPSGLISSGFYRVHLWVLMGVNTLAALVTFSGRASLAESIASWPFVMAVAIGTGVACYAGGVAWLFDRRRFGTFTLYVVALASLLNAVVATPWADRTTGVGIALAMIDLASGGVLLGGTLAAMLLGHWYLNTPTMDLAPLKRLVAFLGGALLVRITVCAVGLTLAANASLDLSSTFWVFLSFRWLAGLLGTGAMAWMTWLTLRVPNTQSATGILYTGVILVFLGELVSQLLSVDLMYPV
jgi:hypothetical protein